MIIYTPADAILFATKNTDLTSDGTNIVMRLRRDSAMFYYENRDLMPDDETYADAAEFLRAVTKVDISPEMAKAMLSLYPEARIKIAEYGVSDSDCHDALCFAAAHFFLGSTWPNYGDKIGVPKFVDCLQAEAVRMGFATLPAQQ